MGRPKIILDWDQIALYLQYQCTLTEVAAFCHCSHDKIENACKQEQGMTFSEFAEIHRKEGLGALRRAQWNKAVEKMDSTMLIWLGKQYLNHKDTKDIKAQVEQTTIPQLEEMTKEELKALLGEPDDSDIDSK